MNNVLFDNNLMLRLRPSQLLDTFTDERIRDRYRFRRDSIQFICDIVDADLRGPTRRNHALSVETQVLASMRFLASGCFCRVDADVLGIDKSSVCRVLKGFCEALVSKSDRFLKFPFTDAEKTENKLKFYKMGGFPSCILCVDGFHVRICTPRTDANAFFNRKGYHSINVQAMTDLDYKFAGIVARWPGSTHDSFIFRMSEVNDYLERNHTTLDHGVVTGDSGYALKKFLMTPYEHPRNRPQRRFNTTLKTCRSSVERDIQSGLRVQPDKACLYIVACVILHNIAKMLDEVDFEGDDDEDFDCEPVGPGEDSSDGKVVPDHISNIVFA